MKHPHVLVLMEWYDIDPDRDRRFAAELELDLTVATAADAKGWSGDGILTLINAARHLR
jgi:hypothetical protein